MQTLESIQSVIVQLADSLEWSLQDGVSDSLHAIPDTLRGIAFDLDAHISVPDWKPDSGGTQ